jgi:hypothetical protein
MARARRLLALSALVAVAAVLGGCGGGGATLTAEPLSLEELTAAASTSAEASSGRYEFSMEMSFPGASAPLSFSGDGAFDTTTDRASFTFDLSSLAGLLGGLGAGLGAPDFSDPTGWKIDAVSEGKVVYLKFPLIADQLPEGKSWVRVDPTDAGDADGFDLSQLEQFTSNDPRALLDFLKAVSGEIETVGTEELRGVPTTHYRATIDLRNYDQLVPPASREQLESTLDELVTQSGLSEIPFDVWLDEDSLVRKAELTFSAKPSGSDESLDASMSFELFDYGADVDIDVPPPDQVADASALQG